MLRAIACALLLAYLTTGCTATGERLVPWYVTRKLASYMDLTSAQKKSARATVDETIAVLRRGELPHWISLMREVRAGIHDGLAEDDVARLQRRYDERLDAGVKLLAPRLAGLLVQLDAEQLDHLAERMREDVDEQYEELDEPPQKRAAALEKRALKAVEDAVGDLTDAQEQAIRALIRALPDERPKQYASAKEHIARFRAFMATRPTPAAVELELQRMWAQRYDALGPGHDKTARRAQQRAWLLSVYRLLSAEQRTHAEERLTERIATLKRFVLAE
jgi:hypothetical protein